MADGTQTAAPQAAAPAAAPQSASLESLMAGLMGAEDQAAPATTEPVDPAAEPKVPEEGEDKEPVDPAAAAADMIEFDGADGKPVQVSLQDAIAAYTERDQLKTQVAELSQRSALMPQEVEHALLTVAQTRQQLLQEVEQLQSTYKPQPPSRALLDKTSPDYDPDLYANQLSDYERGVQWLQQVDQQKQQQQHIQQREQAALQQAAIARGRQQLQQVWPDVLTDPATKQGLAELLQHVGFDPATALSTVTDPRAYLVMKLAMQGLKYEAQAKGQIKAVRSTPRLVKGAGRSPTTPQQADPAARARLSQTGRLDDALAFLMGS